MQLNAFFRRHHAVMMWQLNPMSVSFLDNFSISNKIAIKCICFFLLLSTRSWNLHHSVTSYLRQQILASCQQFSFWISDQKLTQTTDLYHWPLPLEKYLDLDFLLVYLNYNNFSWVYHLFEDWKFAVIFIISLANVQNYFDIVALYKTLKHWNNR